VQANTALTERIAAVTSDIHAVASGQPTSQLSDDDGSTPPHPPATDA
jgi:hypothetical protein